MLRHIEWNTRTHRQKKKTKKSPTLRFVIWVDWIYVEVIGRNGHNETENIYIYAYTDNKKKTTIHTYTHTPTTTEWY